MMISPLSSFKFLLTPNCFFPLRILQELRAFASRSDDVDSLKERSRLIARGETLILVGETAANRAGERFLRCLDAAGENVFLPLDMRGCRFSAVAKEGNISGVHTAGNLLNKRPPFMARLVHGEPPPAAGSTPSHSPTPAPNFVPELRILAALEEECLFGLVLGKDSARVLPLPPSALLKVQAAANSEELQGPPSNPGGSPSLFSRLVARAREAAEAMEDRMAVHDVAFARDIRLNGAGAVAAAPPPPTVGSSDLSYQQRRKARRASQV